ncbi:hypothetical protein SISSUDRAFT_1000750 [Sistotremastrum suecicum HHB10207 ss-3]|uniref:DUF7727 domain-containing protein n=1 Tax=Sistotremastrum suecicum HHB10207 ss-3 TaxID=1314776 RepID=A0A166GBK3_9AGAM|nr:hypothetical protein SISSUDRAFT_1000750 [Sistotremastrum suecicum HHB10207 ss-3]
MGVFIWHDWARFVSLAASIYLVWAGYWAIFYRKFFWDIVGGIVRDPGGIQPSRGAEPFISVIVKAPIIQIMVIIVSLITLMVELPAPFIKGTSIYRSWTLRIVLLIFQAFLGVLLYQGTNGALYSLIAAYGYTMAQMKGETMPEPKKGGGRGDRA